MELFIHPAAMIQEPLEKEVRSLMDKYYVPLELAALGRERRHATKTFTDEVMILAESFRMTEAHFAAQLEASQDQELSDVPWLSEGIGLKTLDFIALKLGVGLERRNLTHQYEKIEEIGSSDDEEDEGEAGEGTHGISGGVQSDDEEDESDWGSPRSASGPSSSSSQRLVEWHSGGDRGGGQSPPQG